MKIYQVATRDSFDEHQGYTYHTNKKEALKEWRNSGREPQEEDFSERELKLTKKDVLAFLNAYCSHPDNG